jgi:membrane protein YqaA with SNARE-associated domain
MSLEDLLADLSYWGPAGGFLAGLLDGAVLPLVNLVDVVLVVRGAAGDPEAWLFAAATWLGSVAGSMILLHLSRQGRRAPGLRQITQGRAARYVKRMERYPALALFMSAAVPAPLPVKALIVAAGLLKVSAWRIGLAVAAARGARYFGLTWLGQIYGESITYFLREYRWPMLGAVVLTFSVIVLWWLFVSRGKHSLRLTGDPHA